jgi:hypothetical protein
MLSSRSRLRSFQTHAFTSISLVMTERFDY